MVEIKATPAGVPVIVDGDEVVTLSHDQMLWVQALCMENPGLIDQLESAVRSAIEVITGIDADQDMNEWWNDFQNLLTVNQFQNPLSVLNQVRRNVDEMMGAEA